VTRSTFNVVFPYNRLGTVYKRGVTSIGSIYTREVTSIGSIYTRGVTSIGSIYTRGVTSIGSVYTRGVTRSYYVNDILHWSEYDILLTCQEEIIQSFRIVEYEIDFKCTAILVI